MKDKYDKQIGLLDWLIFISIIILFFMVYVPLSVWEEEGYYRELRRDRMKNIAYAEEFFYELTGEYTTDINELFPLVEAAMDSLIADSTFVGKQTINIQSGTYEVSMDESFHIRVDTTFSTPEIIKLNVIDTLYKVGIANEDNNSLVDTIWVNSKSYIDYKNDSKFIGEYITHYENENGDIVDPSVYFKDEQLYKTNNFKPQKMKLTKHVDTQTNYLRRKFHLKENLVYCPISKNNIDKKKFILNIDKANPSSPIFSIKSPLTKDDNELRYGIFRFRPGKMESIVAGEKSWAGE